MTQRDVAGTARDFYRKIPFTLIVQIYLPRPCAGSALVPEPFCPRQAMNLYQNRRGFDILSL